MNAGLYFAVVLIWGTTWIAIAAQHGEFTPAVAVFWRFILAAGLLFAILLLSGRLKRLSLADHGFCVLQGFCIFGFNFICFYSAIAYINSGLEAVIFSMAVLFNTLNSRLFFKQPVSAYFFPAALLGFGGMLALFWHDLAGTELHWQTLMAIALCMLGSYGFSLGNMISLRHQQRGLDVFSTNAWAMLYGALIMALLAGIRGENFFPAFSLTAGIALLYLSIVGSVIGFTAYFILVGRIGAGQAAYSTLLFPLVALTISTIWENYQWSLSAVVGVLSILLGNFILFTRPKWLYRILLKFRPSRLLP
ncbi:DMT family transporter [Acinetobacter sp. WZC-1]|uniref:DMT family transporter n=1 Tax=Acinetobacter sp. WZC-1 TaxID=3459034 RepID=UPI00403D68D7